MTTTRRQFVKIAGMTGLGGALASLGGCDAAWDDLAQSLDAESRIFAAPDAASIDDVAHVINRLSFGQTPGEYARVRERGVEAFIEEQLHPAEIRERRRASWKVASIETLHEPRAELFEHHPDTLLHDMTRAKLLRAVYSRKQLQEVMVDFWTDHLNIVSAKGQCKWLKLADDRDVIRRHALGMFPDMIRASALSPAMLIYLDGHDNRVGEPGDTPNENYARELLELHTLGVNGGYTQQDVMEVARCLSGWTYGHTFLQPDRVRFVPEHHDDGEKIVLGTRIDAGGGAADLERVIDIVCAHPSTARHIATRLCRRFIAIDPPAEAVDVVARTYHATGGNIRAMLRALFQTSAFRDSRGTLFKRPFRFVVSALRATDALTDAGPPVIEALERMGHLPFQYPTPDGYPMEPEPWLGTLLWRWNFALGLEENTVNGTTIDRDAMSERFADARDLIAHHLGRLPTPEEHAIIKESPTPLALVLASPAFQRY